MSRAMRRYAKENPMTEGGKIALAVGGLALLGGLGYLIYVEEFKTGATATIAFVPSSFVQTTAGPPSPAYAQGKTGALLTPINSNAITGTLTNVIADSTGGNNTTNTFTVTASGNTTYPVGTIITGVPAAYLI